MGLPYIVPISSYYPNLYKGDGGMDQGGKALVNTVGHQLISLNKKAEIKMYRQFYGYIGVNMS